MVVEYDPRPAPGQQWQQVEKRVVLGIFDEDQIGRGKELPIWAVRRRRGETMSIRSQRRVQPPVGRDEQSHVGPTVGEDGDLFGELAADGVTSRCGMGQQCDPHERPSVDLRHWGRSFRGRAS